MRLYRITKQKYAAQAFTGTGAAQFGGRWNSPGGRVLYCATSADNAVRELQVYLGPVQPSGFVLSTVEVPDHISRRTIWRSDLPHVTAGDIDNTETRRIGDDWLRRAEACMLVVPSKFFHDDFHYLINPLHREFEHLTTFATTQGVPEAVQLPKLDEKRMVFLCHASEDKDDVVRPVRDALFDRNINSWFDEAEITLGDSITRKVNKGLAEAQFVIVFISPAFTKKPWPKRELEAALNREARTGKKVVIPIVIHYELDRVDYAAFLPLGEDKVYGTWDGDANRLADQIARSIQQQEG